MSHMKIVEWVLRAGVFGEFLGHGALALGGKQSWLAWFPMFGITDPVLAKQLLFLIGAIDVTLALLVLIRPVRAALLWMVFGGFGQRFCVPWWESQFGISLNAGQTGERPWRCCY